VTGVPGPHGSFPLARAAVHRAAERREDGAWLDGAWADPRARVLVVDEGRTPVADRPDGSVALALVPPAAAPDGPRYLLGVEDAPDGGEVAYFAVAGPADGAARHDGAARVDDLRGVGALLDDRDAGLLVHAVALDAWHRTHPCCARCGARTDVASAGHVRRCPADGSQHFPRTDPAVIMLVTDGDDRCLLGRQARWPERRFSTLAGFVEPGESLEQAVAREVAEEVGLRVLDTAYDGSQPWPFPASLMLGFRARVDGGDPRVDGEEIAEARWFTRDALHAAVVADEVRLPPSLSIARRLVEGWYGAGLPAVERWR
jgi:NAD+ diphosphatase